MIDKLINIIEEIVQKSLNFEPKNKKDFMFIIIRLNDLTKIASEFEVFKQKCISLLDPSFSQRVEVVYDDYFRAFIQNINAICEIIGLFILKSEIE